MGKEDFINFIADKYNINPDYPWDGDNETTVFRHRVSKKWFALLMRISADKIGRQDDKRIWTVNFKANKWNIPDLTIEKGIYPAYHMSKVHWITVALDEVNMQVIDKLLEESFTLTRTKKDM